MTRDEVIDELSKDMDASALAQQICHDAFDSFVYVMAERLGDLDVTQAWRWFKEGWESQS